MSVKAKVKVGDTIIVTLPGVVSSGKRCIVVNRSSYLSSVVDTSDSIWVKREDNTGGTFLLRHNSYRIIRKIETAKPGDIIVVINPDHKHLFKKEYVVIEPSWCPSVLDDVSECIWIGAKSDASRSNAWLYHSDYEIVKRVNHVNSASCLDCNDTGIIELFTSTVKCKCKK